MAKSAKSAKSAKRSRKSAKAPSSGTSQAISTSDNDEASPGKAKARRVHWNVARTERLLDWLDENPEDRQKLFSDSSKDAKEEGRRKRVAKNTKTEFYKKIATYIFSVDDDSSVRGDFHASPGNYSKSVDNYIIRYVFFSISYVILNFLAGCGKNIARLTRNLVRRVQGYDMKTCRRVAICVIWLVSAHIFLEVIYLVTH
jgi:hypothetical protein